MYYCERLALQNTEIRLNSADLVTTLAFNFARRVHIYSSKICAPLFYGVHEPVVETISFLAKSPPRIKMVSAVKVTIATRSFANIESFLRLSM